MVPHILVLAIEFLAHGAILLLLLWIMIKVQSLNYNFLGLLGSAALGSGLDMIPYFGHSLAVPVLYLCIWKVTQSSLFPDAAFTVVVAYALMFAVNVFLLASLMGDLRPHDTLVPGDDNFAQEASGETDAAAASGKPAPVATATQVPAADANEAEKITRQFSIKGVTRNNDKSAVTILCGTKTYTLFLGRLVSVQTDDGLVSVRFTELGKDYVVLNIRGAQVKCPISSK
jgi:hypothetical protein